MIGRAAEWFVGRRGRALGIGSMGTAMGPLIFPFLVTFLLSVFDWRDAWFALGLITLVVLGPISLLVRTRPEDMGLLPDGDAEAPRPRQASDRARAARHRSSEQTSRAREAVRMQCFWLLIIASSLTTLGTGGFHANWLPYFHDLGFTSAQGSLAATAYGICSISTRVVWGWLADRYPVRYVLACRRC